MKNDNGRKFETMAYLPRHWRSVGMAWWQNCWHKSDPEWGLAGGGRRKSLAADGRKVRRDKPAWNRE